MAEKRTYPYTAWMLQPSFKPVEVTIVAAAWPESPAYSNWEHTDKKKAVNLSDLFFSKSEAIDDGWERIKKQQADLDKKQENLNKRRAALEKASHG